MSTHLIEAIDLTEAAQQAIATAITDKTIPVADLAATIAELSAINATLLAELSAIRSMLGANTQQSITLNLKCCPHPIVDCSTGEVTWVDPPRKVGGNEGGTIVTVDDGVDVQEAIDNIGPDGLADGAYDFGGNDGSGRGYTTSKDADATICENANWFVYNCSGVMDEISSVWGYLDFSLDTLTSIMGGFGLIGTTPLFYVTAGSAAAATFITVGVSVAAIVTVFALIDKLLSLAGAGLKAQWSSALEADLVCAIVVGAEQGGDGIKRLWDNTVNSYVPAVNPLRWYYKYLLTKDMANALAKGQLRAGEAKYGYTCDCVQTTGWAKVAVWKSFDGGSSWSLASYSRYYYIWPDGLGVSEVGDQGCPWDATRFTFSDTDSTYDPSCRRNHSGDLNGYRIRETTGVGASFRANTQPPYCDGWGLGATIPSDGSWLNINQTTENANIWRGDNGDFTIEIEAQP